MNLLIRHAEYLLGRRNCVVLPGLGALICAIDAARFDQRHPGMLLPPRRRIAFNAAITADDGLLSASFCRGLGLSLPDAEAEVAKEVESLRRKVMVDGSASFGRLGFFRTTSDGNIAFSAARRTPANNAFASLLDVDVDRLIGASKANQATSAEAAKPAAITAPIKPTVSEKEIQVQSEAETNSGDKEVVKVSRWRKVRNGAAGVAASLAVLVTITLFLLNPIRMANEPQKASIAPIPASSPNVSTEQAKPEKTVRRLTIGLPQGQGFVEVLPEEIASRKELRENFSRLNEIRERQANGTMADRFCVIVASFPTMSQARSYIASKGGALAILEKDGKCRVYAATAPTYEAANELRNNCGVADAWVCRR